MAPLTGLLAWQVPIESVLGVHLPQEALLTTSTE